MRKMSEYSPNIHPYKKLGGLLKFWVVLAPIILVFTIFLQFIPSSYWRMWPAYEGAEYWLRFAMQLCQIYGPIINVLTAVMIIRRDPRFARTWQLGFLGNIVSTAVRWPLYLSYGYLENSTITGHIIATIGLPVTFSLMMLYFARSVRVRTYMGTDKYLRLAFFTRNVCGPMPAVPDEVESN